MNTKNILIFIMLIFLPVSLQAQVYHYNGGNITDSAGIITFKKPVRMMNTNQDFGYGSSLWNFRLENDEGTITWRANNDRDLMVYDDDGHIWNLIGTLQVNGVPISAGGGDAYLTNRQTFTKRNIFSDTLKADALSLMEQVRIADWFQVTGDVISDLNFLKGSSTSIGTISTDSLAIITNNTKRIIINQNGYMSFLDSVKLNYYTFADSLYTKNITPNDGFGLVWTNPSSIKSVSGSLLFNSSSHNFNTQYGTFLAIIDSANGLQLSKDIDTTYMDSKVYKTNNLDTTRFLDNSDTSSFFRVGDGIIPITETVNSVVNFLANVIFGSIPTVAQFYQDAARTKLFSLPQSASDTLLTRSQTQTVTNKTISGSSNTVTGIKSGMCQINQLVFAPADATTYYFGGNSTLTPQSSEGQRRLYFPMACTIKSVIVSTFTTGAPSSETISLYIRKNATTDSTISTAGAWNASSGYNVISNYNMGVVISQGDFIEFKLVCPTWATNPTLAYINVSFYFE